MKKRYAWPTGHWDWPIRVSHKHGVRCGDMIWVGGQVDLTSSGEVAHPDNIDTQTDRVMENFARVLKEVDCGLPDLVNLNCFYVAGEGADESHVLRRIAGHLPAGTRTAITPVPVPCLAYPGLTMEVEGVAMRHQDGNPTRRACAKDQTCAVYPDPFCDAVRSGKMIFVSAQSATDGGGAALHKGSIVAQTEEVMNRIGATLRQFGADFEDVVKINRWYKGDVGIEDFEPASLACAAYFSEPGPAATGIPLPRHADPDILVKIGVIAMLGENGERLERRHVWPESLWDWHIHLPYKHGLKCEEMIFLGGQVALDKQGRAVHPNHLSAQTHVAMKHIGTILQELGAGYEDVCKVLTLYKGDGDAATLHENLSIRSSCFPDPGPATTGVPLPGLAYDAMLVEIDIYAMATTPSRPV